MSIYTKSGGEKWFSCFECCCLAFTNAQGTGLWEKQGFSHVLCGTTVHLLPKVAFRLSETKVHPFHFKETVVLVQQGSIFQFQSISNLFKCNIKERNKNNARPKERKIKIRGRKDMKMRVRVFVCLYAWRRAVLCWCAWRCDNDNIKAELYYIVKEEERKKQQLSLFPSSCHC